MFKKDFILPAVCIILMIVFSSFQEYFNDDFYDFMGRVFMFPFIYYLVGFYKENQKSVLFKVFLCCSAILAFHGLNIALSSFTNFRIFELLGMILGAIITYLYETYFLKRERVLTTES